MNKHLLFTYGTLKSGHVRYRYLQGQRYLGVGITNPDHKIYQLSGHPALTDYEHQKGNFIHGELYEVDEECIKQLDIVEAVAHGLYERKPIGFSEMNLAFLPTDQKVFESYQQKLAEAYIYKKSVEGAKDCNQFWCKG